MEKRETSYAERAAGVPWCRLCGAALPPGVWFCCEDECLPTEQPYMPGILVDEDQEPMDT